MVLIVSGLLDLSSGAVLALAAVLHYLPDFATFHLDLLLYNAVCACCIHHDCFLRKFTLLQLARDMSFAHDVYPVTHTNQFGGSVFRRGAGAGRRAFGQCIQEHRKPGFGGSGFDWRCSGVQYD